VYLLDLDKIFAGASRYAAPGFDLFLDYVHPTKSANLLVAQSAFELMISNHILIDDPETNQFTHHDLPYGPNGEPYRDETDFDSRLTEIQVATENHQYARVVRAMEVLMQQRTGHHLTGPDDPIWASNSPESAHCYKAFYNYLNVQRRAIMGEPVSEAELQQANRQVDEYYEKWYPLGRF
jgi:hypothetical protein